jgi:hypothetical protein
MQSKTYDDPPAVRRPQPAPDSPNGFVKPSSQDWQQAWQRTFPILRIVIWSVACVLTLGVGFLGVLMEAAAKTSIHEATGAAMTAAGLIGVYALARAFSSIANEVERMLTKGRTDKAIARKVWD